MKSQIVFKVTPSGTFWECLACGHTFQSRADEHDCLRIKDERVAALEAYLRDLLADIDHAWETRAVQGLKYIEYQFTRNETEELRKLIGEDAERKGTT